MTDTQASINAVQTEIEALQERCLDLTDTVCEHIQELKHPDRLDLAVTMRKYLNEKRRYKEQIIKLEQAIQNQGKTEELNQMLRAQTSGLQSASTQLDKREMARILYEYKQLHYALEAINRENLQTRLIKIAQLRLSPEDFDSFGTGHNSLSELKSFWIGKILTVQKQAADFERTLMNYSSKSKRSQTARTRASQKPMRQRPSPLAHAQSAPAAEEASLGACRPVGRCGHYRRSLIYGCAF